VRAGILYFSGNQRYQWDFQEKPRVPNEKKLQATPKNPDLVGENPALVTLQITAFTRRMYIQLM